MVAQVAVNALINIIVFVVLPVGAYAVAPCRVETPDAAAESPKRPSD